MAHESQVAAWVPSLAYTTAYELHPKNEPTESDLFALLRHWDPETLSHRDRFITELSRANIDINAQDVVGGGMPIHLVVQSGAPGVGNDDDAAETVLNMLREGADSNLKDDLGMTPLHHAAYYGCPKTMDVLLRSQGVSGEVNVNEKCGSLGCGTCLHLAVLGGNLDCLKALLDARANTEIPNEHDQRPIDIARLMLNSPSEFDDADVLREMIELLEKHGARNVYRPSPVKRAQPAAPVQPEQPIRDVPPPTTRMSEDALRRFTAGLKPINMSDAFSDTSSMTSAYFRDDGDINVGDRVLVDKRGEGIVRFKGNTKFKPGLWYGVQLDHANGKNNGSVGLVTYFRTKPQHGCFVRRNRLTRINSRAASRTGSPFASPSLKMLSPAKQRAVDRVKGRSPAPFTAPTFRTKETVRPDHGEASKRETYAFAHQHAPSSRGSDGARSHRQSIDSRQSEFQAKLKTPSPRSRTGASSTGGKSHRMLNQKGRAGPKLAAPKGAAPFGPMVDSFAVHSRVLVGSKMGVVLYLGACHLGQGLWIGVQLNEAVAKGHNGTVDDQRYFRCPDGTGVLKPARKVYWHGKKVSDVVNEQDYNLASEETIDKARRNVSATIPSGAK
eukprot:TRINITY_DN12535_c1_g1_i1.p1 TRINITY_DN12535_c1_g1~~TRINITY_DN12535_c1_g1_i1.p1  ORF type:complete len:613 (+),score=122.65 TRINITY_DN12535_c1_g1_i1:131-1969(+)